MSSYYLEQLWQSSASPRVELVFVHGYGSKPETCWHHDKTGKFWIDDEEFILQITRPLRILSFTYNGDVAANMTSASLAFHAADLLECLDQASENTTGPIFFIAHGMGGMIVKKALKHVHLMSDYPRLKRRFAGITFFGTPHVDEDAGAMLEVVRNVNVAFGSPSFKASDEDIREYSQVALSLNRWVSQQLPSSMTLLSYWERKPTVLRQKSDEAAREELIVVPESCRLANLYRNKDIEVDCTHPELVSFSAPYDLRFKEFVTVFSELIETGLGQYAQQPLLSVSLRPPKSDPPRPPSALTATKKGKDARNGKKKDETAGDNMEARYQDWKRRSNHVDHKKAREAFLSSLHGWTQANTGAGIVVAPGTCQWINDDPWYTMWTQDSKIGTFFMLGMGAQGKTHAARAIISNLNSTYPADKVMGFFCDRNDPSPPVWEYFTWHLIKDDPSWLYKVPQRFLSRDKDSPRLGPADFLEIWTCFRKARYHANLWLIIDGLEQCGDEAFTRVFDAVQQLRQVHITTPTFPILYEDESRSTEPLFKVLFSCRISARVLAASALLSRTTLSLEATKRDVSSFIHSRLEHFPGSSPETLAELKRVANNFWPYAKFAVQEVESGFLPKLGPGQTLDSSYLPAALGDWIREQLLPVLQHVGPESWIRTLLVLLRTHEFNVVQIRDALPCLYGEEIRDMDIVEGLRQHLGAIAMVKEDDFVGLIDSSVARFLGRSISAQQSCTNVVFLHTKYLLQDRFRKPLPSSNDLLAEQLQTMNNENPFYAAAAKSLISDLGELESVDESLGLLLNEFFRDDSPNFKTWQAYLSWDQGLLKEPDTPTCSEDPAIITLLLGGCLPVLKHIYAPPKPTPCTSHSWLNYVRRTLDHIGHDSEKYVPFPPDWPDTANGRKTSAIRAAMISSQNVLPTFEYVLSYSPDLNATAENGSVLLTTLKEWIPSEGPAKPLIKTQQYRMCRELLEHGADPHRCDSLGMTPLQAAAGSDDVAFMCIFLEFTDRIDLGDIFGGSLLWMAYRKGSTDVVRELLAAGADANIWWPRGGLPLGDCIRHDSWDMFRLLLEYADPNMVDRAQQSALCVAIKTPGSRRYMEALLAHPDIQLDDWGRLMNERLDNRGRTLLDLAVQCQNQEAVSLLLQAGAWLGGTWGDCTSPLLTACYVNSTDLVELLLSHHAPVNTYHSADAGEARTALVQAVCHQNEELIATLLQHGADPTVEEAYGRPNCLHALLRLSKPKVSVLRQLLEAPIPPAVDYVPKDGHHAVLLAARKGWADMTRVLLEHGGVDTKIWIEGTHRSPIHEAIWNGHKSVVEVLLEFEPALLNYCNDHSYDIDPPLSVAVDEGRAAIVKYLLDKGAKPDQRNHWFNETPLIMACHRRKDKLVKLLLDACPEAVNYKKFLDCTALIEACDNGDLKSVELLLRAGADVRHLDMVGSSCVSRQLFSHKGKAKKMLQMLTKHGLDLNETCCSEGHTPTGLAVMHGSVDTVKWVLENGGDPLRCSRSFHKPFVWGTALQHAVSKQRVDLIDLLMEPRWGLRDKMLHQGAAGQTLLSLLVPDGDEVETKTHIYFASEKIRAETGRDAFLEMMHIPSAMGHTPLDYVLNPLSVKPEAVPLIMARAIAHLDAYISGNEGKAILHELAFLLDRIGGFDVEIPYVARPAYSLPEVEWEDSKPGLKSKSLWLCARCDGSMSDKFYVCRQCTDFFCQECKEKGALRWGDLHVHSWREMYADYKNTGREEWFLEYLQGIKHVLEEQLRDALVKEVVEGIMADAVEQESEQQKKLQDEGRRQLQTSLQLATLHAFGYLAFRRRLFTPFLPLARHVEEAIGRWAPVIRDRRRAVERNAMDLEMSPTRCYTEWSYVTRGLRRSYVDEDLYRRDLALQHLEGLFAVPEEKPEKSCDGRQSLTEGLPAS